MVIVWGQVMGKGAPNVITIMVDQLKATALGMYGNTSSDTPNLQRLANEGVLFEHAYTPHPLCVPARISLWTSQYSHTHGSNRNETFMPDDAVHAFKLWKAAGYHTGLIGKNHCFHTEADLDRFDTWCEIEHYGISAQSQTKGLDWKAPIDVINEAHAVRRNMPKLSPRIICAATEFPEEAYSTALVSRQAIRFLEKHQDDPFALWVSLPDPHDPYEVPARYADMFPKDRIQLPPWVDNEMDDAPERNRILHKILGLEQDAMDDVYRLLGIYYGMIQFIDDELGHLLDAIERLGLREKTIIVFCSDHGDFVGEHRMMGKGGLFYDCLTRVPLILSWPGHVEAGRVDHSLVSLIDIVPTLLSLQGLDIPQSMQGKPLPTVTGAAPREAVFAEYGAGGPPFTLYDLAALPQPYGRHTIKETLRWREAEGRRKMVRTKDWKYVHDPMGDKDELYDLVHDPWELKNVVDNPIHRGVVSKLKRRLMDWAGLSAQPLKLCSNRVWRTYRGGRMIEQWQGKPDGRDSAFPEEWVASVTKASNVGREHLEEGFSRIMLQDGTTLLLKDIIASNPEQFLGQAHVDQYGMDTGVLVKVLDAAERLTIQVHPDPEFARQQFHSRFGKTEAWYVLGNRTIDGEQPSLYFGFKPGMNRERWKQLFETQDIAGMLDALHRVPVKEGEVFLVEGGIPHAIGSGCLLIEIQEPSDLTLRTERTTPSGNAVPDMACHQGLGFERMLDCFHYDAYSYEETLNRWKIEPVSVKRVHGGEELCLIGIDHTPCFRMHKLDIYTSFAAVHQGSFAIAIIIDGQGTVTWDGGQLEVSKSDALFIPIACRDLVWANSQQEPLQVVLCYPPEVG